MSPFARLMNMDRLSIGNDSYVSRGTLLLCVVDYKGEKHDPHLVIGNNVYIGNRCSVSCCNEVVFGDDVTVGDHVYIADGKHGYEDITRGVAPQPLVRGSVRIGRMAWLGYGSFIASELEIGEHSVIGANSVVTKSVPPYTVVAGAPAKVIKRYDFALQQWVRA